MRPQYRNLCSSTSECIMIFKMITLMDGIVIAYKKML